MSIEALTLAVAAVLPFGSTLLGGVAVFKLHSRLHAVMAAAAGVLVATALVDLLPEAIELLDRKDAAIFAGAAAVVGYLLYATVESFIHRASHEHIHEGHEHDQELSAHELPPSNLGWLGPAGLIVHSTLDGLAIGLGFAAGNNVGVVVLLAVLVHDFADGLNVVTLAFAGGRRRSEAWLLLGLDATAPLVGVALSQLIAVEPYQLGLLLATFGGAFIAIGAGHLLPEAEHRQDGTGSPLVMLTILGGLLVLGVRILGG